MKIIELVIDELDEDAGIDAISIVEYPAIEEDFVALSKNKEYKFQEVDTEKRLLTGALLVPNKPIYRRDGEEEYYIIFSKDTIRKASELYLMRGQQNRATYEHFKPIDGLTLVESWLVTDKENDKSNSYGMDLPIGTWMGTVKVNNDQVWEDFVKTGMVRGFSIEGFFSEKENDTKSEIEAGLKLLKIKKLLIENEESNKMKQNG